MASKTIKTEHKRLRRDRTSGTTRKAKLRTQGSTKSAAVLFGDEK